MSFLRLGFLLWTANQELCASYYFQDLSLREGQCAVFKHIPYNVKSLFGLCSYKFSSDLTKEEDCNQTKRLSGETIALRWLDDVTYVNLAGSEEAKVGSSNVEVPFLRQHIKSFGVKHNAKKIIGMVKISINFIQIWWAGLCFPVLCLSLYLPLQFILNKTKQKILLNTLVRRVFQSSRSLSLKTREFISFFA